jgi:hypothetical protein
MILHDEPF